MALRHVDYPLQPVQINASRTVEKAYTHAGVKMSEEGIKKSLRGTRTHRQQRRNQCGQWQLAVSGKRFGNTLMVCLLGKRCGQANFLLPKPSTPSVSSLQTALKMFQHALLRQCRVSGQ